jgi:hypothetical protein
MVAGEENFPVGNEGINGYLTDDTKYEFSASTTDEGNFLVQFEYQLEAIGDGSGVSVKFTDVGDDEQTIATLNNGGGTFSDYFALASITGLDLGFIGTTGGREYWIRKVMVAK